MFDMQIRVTKSHMIFNQTDNCILLIIIMM